VLEQPDLRKRLTEQGSEVHPGTREELTRAVAEDVRSGSGSSPTSIEVQ
jgi:hypothetical protein